MRIESKETLAKNILTEGKGYLDVGFTHSLNPYSGCAFSCRYCYVREMPIQKFKDTPWEEKKLSLNNNLNDQHINFSNYIQDIHMVIHSL